LRQVFAGSAPDIVKLDPMVTASEMLEMAEYATIVTQLPFEHVLPTSQLVEQLPQ